MEVNSQQEFRADKNSPQFCVTKGSSDVFSLGFPKEFFSGQSAWLQTQAPDL